eukprot:m51a1_g12511 putative serine threonine protein kinase 15 (331) ;mRNA; f:144-3946
MNAVGTPDYIAPEVLLGLPHGEDVDWWALGCVLFELVVGVPPFSAETVEQTFDNIIAKRLEWPDDVEASDDLKDCVDKLLELSPERRLGGGKPGALDLRRHRFFSGIDWEQLRAQRAPFVPTISDDADTSFFDSRQQVFGQPPPLADASSAPDERIPPADTFLWVNFGHLAEKTREQQASRTDLTVLVVVCIGGYIATAFLIPVVGPKCLAKGLSGRDLHKHSDALIPETLGIVSGTISIICSVLLQLHHAKGQQDDPFDYYESGLLSMTLMLMLGFADDLAASVCRVLEAIGAPAFLSIVPLNIDSPIGFPRAPPTFAAFVSVQLAGSK